LFAVTASAATPEYFPLQVGNSWVYKVTQGRLSKPGTVQVEAREPLDGREYFRVRFFEDTLYLRQADNGSVLVYDRDLKAENVWLPFGAEDGRAVETSMDDCSKMATVASRSAKIRTELGEFDNALQVTYRANCADAGVVQQYFLPYLGMVSHETTSIAGPVRHELVYSRTGATNVDAKTNAFTLALDSKEYKAGQSAPALARVTLRVSEPVQLTFPSGQNSDLKIYDDKGEIAYTWSMDKLFIMVFREERVGPGERSYVMEVPIGNVRPGRYMAEGWLTTQPRLYSAAVSFEVVP
jgi:hypothetical protein